MPPRAWETISHPRGGVTFRELSGDIQAQAHASMESLGAQRAGALRDIIATAHERAGRKIAETQSAGKNVPAKAWRGLAILKQGREASADIPPTGMEASVSRITEAAMAPVMAARKEAKETGEMRAPLAGEFYPVRHEVGRRIGEATFGKGTEESYRLQVASPAMSPRTPPQQEVSGAAGMGGVLKGGEDIGIHLSSQLASHLSGMKGSTGPIRSGQWDFASLSREHPHAAALMLQHGARESGLVVPKQEVERPDYVARQELLKAGSRVDIPSHLEEPTSAFVRGYGVSGFPKAGRALAQFHGNMEQFGGHDLHKVPSYTWNIHEAGGKAMALGTHHFLGAMTHGKKWFEANPDAEQHIRKAASMPQWHDPTSTIDVWSGRLASGLPFHVARALGESTNPEDVINKLAGGGHGLRRKGSQLGNAGDVGYLWGEEAHRQAGESMRVRLPGGGHVSAPGHVVQSLGWYGIQAQEYAAKIKSGEKTLTPSSMHDPRSLNALTMPRVWS